MGGRNDCVYICFQVGGEQLKWSQRLSYQNWLKPGLESGLDWLKSSNFAEQWFQRMREKEEHSLSGVFAMMEKKKEGDHLVGFCALRAQQYVL